MTCKDCIHYDICSYNAYVQAEYSGRAVETYITIDNKLPCRFFKDEARYIESPCKVGDRVWCLNEIPQKDIFECKVSSIEMDKNNSVIVVDRIVGIFVLQRVRGYYFSDIGKTVFLTKEEAEKALAERSSNGKNN